MRNIPVTPPRVIPIRQQPHPVPAMPTVIIYQTNIHFSGDAQDVHVSVGGHYPPQPRKFWPIVSDAIVWLRRIWGK